MILRWSTIPYICKNIDLGSDSPVIDLSDVSLVEPFGLIYLGMFLRHFNIHEEKYFSIITPKHKSIADYLINQNFYTRFNTIEGEPQTRQFINTTTGFGDIIDIEKNDDLASNVSLQIYQLLAHSCPQAPVGDIDYVISELLQNYVEHADDAYGAIMVQYYSTLNDLRISIGDCGIGIKNSLLQSPVNSIVKDFDSKDAIEYALQLGTTSKYQGGLGLHEVYNTIIKHKGELVVMSGDGVIYINQRGKMYKDIVPFCLPGVQIELCFHTGGYE